MTRKAKGAKAPYSRWPDTTISRDEAEGLEPLFSVSHPPPSDMETPQYVEMRVADLRHKCSETKNPLYAWQAIYWKLSRHEELPAWCLDFLDYVSTHVTHLCEAATQSVNQNESEQLSALGKEPLSELVRQATEILGLGKGKSGKPNSFERLKGDAEKMQDAGTVRAYSVARATGIKMNETAIAKIKNRRSVQERQAKSRAAQGRKLDGAGEV